eukprot:1141174-Pelagomonas_calceolata.AAC.6
MGTRACAQIGNRGTCEQCCFEYGRLRIRCKCGSAPKVLQNAVYKDCTSKLLCPQSDLSDEAPKVEPCNGRDMDALCAFWTETGCAFW